MARIERDLRKVLLMKKDDIDNNGFNEEQC
jgi:hypothetical protein